MTLAVYTTSVGARATAKILRFLSILYNYGNEPTTKEVFWWSTSSIDQKKESASLTLMTSTIDYLLVGLPKNNLSPTHFLLAYFPLSLTGHHWAMILPWLISLVFGLFFPVCLCILSLFNGRRRTRVVVVTEDYQNTITNEKEFCLENLRIATQFYSKILLEEDRLYLDKQRVTNNINNKNERNLFYKSREEEHFSCWRIPKPGVSVDNSVVPNNNESNSNDNEKELCTFRYNMRKTTSCGNNNSEVQKIHQIESKSEEEKILQNIDNNQYEKENRKIIKTRAVTNLCAICLQPYTNGDKIVWSSNPNCIHCFHEHCIFSWLLIREKKQQKYEKKKELHCPCCRQPFVVSSVS